jgi:hypothetical protein
VKNSLILRAAAALWLVGCAQDSGDAASDPAAGTDAAFDSGAGGEITLGGGVEDPDAPIVVEFSIYAEGGDEGRGRWTPGELEVDLDAWRAASPATAGALGQVGNLAPGTCIPGRMNTGAGPRLDLGEVRVSGLCGDQTLHFDAGQGGYPRAEPRPEASCYTPGETVSLDVAGGSGVAAFAGAIELPEGATVTGPTAPADIRSGLTVTWTSQGNADLTFVGLEGYDGLWGSVSCRVDDTGSFTVPADILAQAGAEAGGDPGYIWLVRANRVELSAAGLGAGRIVAMAVAGAMFSPAP